MAERKLFEEVKEGVDALKEARLLSPTEIDQLSATAYNDLILLAIDEIKALFREDDTTTPEVAGSRVYRVSTIHAILDKHAEILTNKRGQAQKLFQDYKEVMESRVRLDDKRLTIIKRALKNYPVEDLMLAIRGCVLTPWNMGTDPKNTNKTVYNTIELIFRDANHIERFRDTAIAKGIDFNAKIRKSDYDGSRKKPSASLAEFSSKGEL